MILFKSAATSPSMLCQEKLSVLMISMKVFINMYHPKFTANIIIRIAYENIIWNCFASGQGRLDGAFCEYTSKDKDNYMIRLKDAGVTNIEMESTAFVALTHKAGFKSAVVCVTLLDRLNEDQVKVLYALQ